MLVVIFVLASLAFFFSYPEVAKDQNQEAKPSGFHFGVSFCGNTTAQAELLINKVKAYTNLLVIQSGPVSVNETAINEIVNYAVASGLDVIVYFGYFNPNDPWQIPWLDYAKQEWGSHFLGIYLNDEPGGQAIDANWTAFADQFSIGNTSDYYMHVESINLALNGTLPFDSYEASEAAYHFVTEWREGLDLSQLQSRSINSFTSDYALYWFDYLIGYNTIFAELGSNQSATQAIDLVRGAADLQNKTWGTIVTWDYDQSPYIENSSALYSQLVESYQAGANYEVIFDYPQIPGDPYGILTPQDFVAMQKFWNDISTLKVKDVAEAALVLPQDYGWGMRSAQDLIWGLWKPDSTSAQIWTISRKLLSEYGLNLDIVYQDPAYPVQGRYKIVYYWNQTL
jgi:hypothetical protein